jgi:hypothetical protein
MTIKFCRGYYPHRWHFIPSIELENYEKNRTYLCLVFLKWYVGVCIDKEK